VTYEEASLKLDTLSDGEVVFNLFYIRWEEDTVLGKPIINVNESKIEEE